MNSIEEVKVVPPVQGSCPICATKHDPGEPHDRDSLYYQNQFWRKHTRFPTWSDAMSHCKESVKDDFIMRMKKRGIEIHKEDADK